MFGKVTRIGSFFIDYGRGRNGTLTQVGGLRVNYSRWGEIASVRGIVNQDNRYAHYDVYDHKDWGHRNDRFDDDNYYYKENGNGNAKKTKK